MSSVLAHDVLTARFPQALGAILAGSAARGEATAGSDLDLVVLLAGPPAPMRATERHDGTLVELFVHTEDSLDTFLAAERAGRRSPLLHMLADGTVVRDTDGRLARRHELARRAWAAGPDALDVGELEDRRYRLTWLLDDLVDEPDPDARAAVAADVFTDVADLALVSRGAWSGTGRWLVRGLAAVEPDLGRRLTAGLRAAVGGDPQALVGAARSELDRLGGPLDAGYERRA